MAKINTLDSLNGEDDHGHSSGEDSNEGRQEFFAGGGERSGQNVLGPNDAERRAQKLFDAARRAGAEEITPEEAAKLHAGSGKGKQGGGYRLGTSADPPIERPVTPIAINRAGPVIVRVIVWENGFSIDDGPLRSFEDPASRQFLMSIQLGSVPLEIQQQFPGRTIDMHMERRSIPYTAPKSKPFSGQGMRLGN